MIVEFTNINAENMRAAGEMSSIDPKHEDKSLKEDSSQDIPLNKQEVEDLTVKIQDSLDRMDISLDFSTYGKKDERIAITVTEKGTGKEIRKIPSEELQQLYLKMNELTGILFNHTI
jgi:flagellar protein FlaG